MRRLYDYPGQEEDEAKEALKVKENELKAREEALLNENERKIKQKLEETKMENEQVEGSDKTGKKKITKEEWIVGGIILGVVLLVAVGISFSIAYFNKKAPNPPPAAQNELTGDITNQSTIIPVVVIFNDSGYSITVSAYVDGKLASKKMPNHSFFKVFGKVNKNGIQFAINDKWHGYEFKEGESVVNYHYNPRL